MLDVRKLLAQRPLLFDGGMGTYYKAKPGQECEQANLTDPEGILAVHRAYLAAGADAIKTNTFSLPRLAAAQQPGWEQLADAGWQLAAKAAGETGAAVFADLGPAPDTENLPAAQVYLAVAKRFALLGAKNFLFETLSTEEGVLEAIRALKQTVPETFVLVSFAVLPDGYTREGRYCAELVRRMAQSGVVDAVGLNCVSAPGAMRALVQQLGDAGLPLSVMPNAGYPVVARAQVRYQGRPAYFARELSRLAAEGVRILGGCCGTTPQHIAALRTALDALPEALPAAPAAKPAATVQPAVETDYVFLRQLCRQIDILQRHPLLLRQFGSAVIFHITAFAVLQQAALHRHITVSSVHHVPATRQHSALHACTTNADCCRFRKNQRFQFRSVLLAADNSKLPRRTALLHKHRLIMSIQRSCRQQALQRVAQKLAAAVINIRLQLADAICLQSIAIYRVFFCALSSINSARRMLGRSY